MDIKTRIFFFLSLLPGTIFSQFDGAVGTLGCQAVYCEDEAIFSWATTCTIERGYQNIASPQLLVSYGLEQDVVGPATIDPTKTVSLGDGGIATLMFDIPIVNGDGYDFAVFENSLNDLFLELAFVEVSSDGVHFVRFPSVSNTPTEVQVGTFGEIDPTQISGFAGKYRVGWGTPFDLAVLSDSSNINLNYITHVRIIDVVGTIDTVFATYDTFGTIVNDPYPTDFNSGGFDLSGVAILNGWLPSAVQSSTASMVTIYPNPCEGQFTVSNGRNSIIYVYDAYGKLLDQSRCSDFESSFSVASYPSGIYFIQIDAQIIKLIKR